MEKESILQPFCWQDLTSAVGHWMCAKCTHLDHYVITDYSRYSHFPLRFIKPHEFEWRDENNDFLIRFGLKFILVQVCK